jgi:hypothetical protein
MEKNLSLDLNVTNDCSIDASDLSFYREWVDCSSMEDTGETDEMLYLAC